MQKENDLRTLTELQDKRGEIDKREWQSLLQEEGIGDDGARPGNQEARERLEKATQEGGRG